MQIPRAAILRGESVDCDDMKNTYFNTKINCQTIDF